MLLSKYDTSARLFIRLQVQGLHPRFTDEVKSTRGSRLSGKETNAILTLSEKDNILPTYDWVSEDDYCGLTFCNMQTLLIISWSLSILSRSHENRRKLQILLTAGYLSGFNSYGRRIFDSVPKVSNVLTEDFTIQKYIIQQAYKYYKDGDGLLNNRQRVSLSRCMIKKQP